jgi:hypothetical protein
MFRVQLLDGQNSLLDTILFHKPSEDLRVSGVCKLEFGIAETKRYYCQAVLCSNFGN